jgi:cyclophilin family peptidyl-prolyl cis-trans isomerase
MLGKAPQLDGNYCIFGHVADNARTQKTLNKIEENWDDHRYCIETRKKAL